MNALQQALLPILAITLPLALGGGIRQDESRRHAVDGDTERAELEAELLRQPTSACFDAV